MTVEIIGVIGFSHRDAFGRTYDLPDVSGRATGLNELIAQYIFYSSFS
jgi:hypothetical protein